MNLKGRLSQIESLAKEYAKLAQQYGIAGYLKEIGVTYQEVIDEVYFVQMGGLSVNVGFGVGFSYKNTQDQIEWLEGDMLAEYQGKYEVLRDELGDILHDMNRRRIKELQEELEVLTVAA